MATFVRLTSQQLTEKAEELALKYNIEKKDLQTFVESKVKEWAQEQKELDDLAREERALKREEEKLKLQYDEEKSKRDHELEVLKLNNTKQTVNTETKETKSKHLKIQVFDGKPEGESVEKFLRAFELLCTTSNIPEKEWPSYLMQSLKGKAREAIAYMDKDQITYVEIKKHLLNHFIKTPDFYRLKYHDIAMDSNSDPTSFVEDVKYYLKTWLEMTNINLNNPNEILEMLIIDKILLMASNKLFTYLKERNITTVKDLIKSLNDFRDSHPHISFMKKIPDGNLNAMANHRRNFNWQNRNNDQWNTRQNCKPNNFNKNSIPQRSQSYNTNNYRRQYNSNSSNFDRKQRYSGNFNNQRKCNNCGKNNHNTNQCRLPRRNNQNSQFNSNISHNNTQRRYKERQNEDHEITQLKTIQQSDMQNCMTELNGKLLLYPGYINNNEVFVLRDTGATSLICLESYILPHQYLTDTAIVTVGDGSKIKCRTANVYIDTPWLTGNHNCIVMKTCIAPIIVGNVKGIKPDNSNEIYQQWIKTKTHNQNIRLPKTLDASTVQNNTDNQFSQHMETLNLLISNNIDQSRWLDNYSEIKIKIDNEKLQTKETIVSDNDTQLKTNKIKHFSGWNGTQNIVEYLDTFEKQCTTQMVPKEIMSIILAQHLHGHNKAYSIAKRNLSDFKIQKVKLIQGLNNYNEVKDTKNQNKTKTKKFTQKQIFGQIINQAEKFPKRFIEINHEILCNEQKRDMSISKILKNLAENDDDTCKNYKIQNNILIKFHKEMTYEKKQIVVPQSLTQNVMEAGHDSPMAGHLGINKTYKSIKSNFYWKKMKTDITNYVKSCDTCLRMNKLHSRHNAPIQKVDSIVSPFYKIAIDIIGPMQQTKGSRYRFVLMIIDLATRWVEAVPLREITSERICTALMSVFTKYGFPTIILSDNGTQFVSQLTQSFNKILEISQIFSARYHPQSNGCIERLNQTIKQMLKKVTIDNPNEWDVYLPMVLFAYRSTVHQSTGFSPFEMLFGKNPKTPIDIFKDTMIDEKEIKQTPYEYVKNVRKHLDYANKLARTNIESQNEKNLENINKNKTLRILKPDDWVLILLPTGTADYKEWKGPYQVIKKQTNVSYKILVDNVEKLFHINNLRLYPTPKVQINESDDTQEDENNIMLVDEQFNSLIQNDELFNSILTNTDKINTIDLTHVKCKEHRDKLQQILNKYSTVISEKPGRTNIIQHEIHLSEYTPFKSKVYTVPQMLRTKVETELTSLLNEGLIQPSQSQFSSPMVLVKKKNNDIRICCDYRKLNKITNIDQEGLSNMEEIINTMGQSTIFSTLDLTRGFWQIPVEQNSKQYTAFTTHMGFYEWNVMPFGLINSTATFTKMMRKILQPHPNIKHYVDDVCIFSNNWDEHFEALNYLFQKLKENNLTISPAKIKLAQAEIEFLGHKFTKTGIQPTSNFNEKILHIKAPTNKKQVRALLGLFNYYSKFIPHYSDLVRPIIDLTRKLQPNKVKWTKQCEDSLQILKEHFAQKSILTTIEEHDKVVLSTDASKVALGACLMKECIVDGETILKPALYLSRCLNLSEKNYPIIELECLAVAWSVRKLQKYLLGRKFVILVDHKPLLKFNINNINNARINKYAMLLSDYSFEIKSVSGKDNHIPDVLSRLSVHIPD